MKTQLLALLLASVSAQALELTPEDAPVNASLGVLLDAESFLSDGHAPGLLFADDDVFFNPRATLLLDVNLGSHLLLSSQARFDRGFDPGSREDGDARLDEYFVRWTPLDEPALNLQVGKFATAFGNWVPRHLSWENPFITAPVPYENVTIMADHNAPASAAAFVNRKNLPDKKRDWLPVVWGPSYAHGAAAFGRMEKFDYALEVKSASISSRPYAWDQHHVDWHAPTYTARLGYRPTTAWALGVSGSTGAYILADLTKSLPRGTDRADYTQDTVGIDFSYAHHHFELWGELMLSRFDVPRVGDADTLSYYLEAKYKLTESLFLAARWNQQFFDEVSNGTGGTTDWDDALSRADLAVGYRFNRNTQVKLQYSLGHERGSQENADHLLAAQLTLRF